MMEAKIIQTSSIEIAQSAIDSYLSMGWDLAEFTEYKDDLIIVFEREVSVVKSDND